MQLSSYDRVVVMAVDVRYPDYPSRVVQLLRDHGAADPQVFLNGRGQPRVDPASYDLVHTGEPPSSWTHTRNEHDYVLAYRAVIRRALEGGDETLLIVEDDVEFMPDFGAVAMRAQVPDDWGLTYYGCFHFWAEEPAEKAASYVVRLNGGQVGAQAVAWRRGAMGRFLAMPIDRPLDWMIAHLHKDVPSYSLEPSVIRQSLGVTSAIRPDEAPFESSFIYQIK